jgi:RNA polymerase sigma factor (sigma-70 family)
LHPPCNAPHRVCILGMYLLQPMALNVYSAQENEWITGCRKGNSAAQKAVYERFSGRMFSLTKRYIREEEAAEDVLITAFTKVFERIEQFKGEGSFEGWIRRIVVNESLTWLRKNKTMYVEVDIAAADREPDFAMLEDHLEAEDLLQMINQLPLGYRTVFNLYAIDGYSHKEIGETMGISENTSKSQLSRARALLQKTLLQREQILKRKIN